MGRTAKGRELVRLDEGADAAEAIAAKCGEDDLRADTWDEAVKEWELREIWFNDDWQACLCTHYPIREVCQI